MFRKHFIKIFLCSAFIHFMSGSIQAQCDVKNFIYSQNKFMIDFPCEPKIETRYTSDSETDLIFKYDEFSCECEKAVYSVLILDLESQKDSLKSSDGLDSLFTRLTRSLIKSLSLDLGGLPLNISYFEPIKYNGIPGKEFKALSTSNEVALFGRIYYRDDKGYVNFLLYNNHRKTSVVKDQFIYSFNFLD